MLISLFYSKVLKEPEIIVNSFNKTNKNVWSVHHKKINLNKTLLLNMWSIIFGLKETIYSFYFLIIKPNNNLYYICIYALIKIKNIVCYSKFTFKCYIIL